MKRLAIVTLFVATSVFARNITVIGLGRLGLCTGLALERAGYNVLGVDIVQTYVDTLNAKKFISTEPFVNEYLVSAERFRATTNLDEGLDFSDVYFIVVDTPTGAREAYDHSKLSRLLSDINKRRVSNKHVIITCTVFPGYINNVAKLLLKDCSNTSISYNPEFIAQGNIIRGFEYPDMVLIGEGSIQAGDLLESIYKEICKSKPEIKRMSPASAEITKLAVNCFITTKIAYANMIADIADKTPEANKHDILLAVGADSRIGLKCLQPGFGFGGPCFPRDNRALGSYAASIGIPPLIPIATDESNRKHAHIMADELINKDQEMYVFEDVNYKDQCPVVIIEESQKLAVAEIIASQGHRVKIKDRSAVIEQVMQRYGNLFEYEIVA